MKKVVKYLSLLIIVLLATTGCGSKKDPKKMLEDALNKMKDVKTMAMKVDIAVGMKAEGMSLEMSMNVSGEVDENHNVYMKVGASLLGYNQSSETYMIHKDGYTYNYTNDGEGWVYTVEEYEGIEELTAEEKNEEIDKFLDSIKEVKEEKSDKEGYTKLNVTIDKVKMNEMISDSQEDVEFNLEKDMVFNVYIKDGYIEIIEMDISELVNKIMSENETEVNMNMTAKVTFELNNFNKIDSIVLPKEIEESATLENSFEYDEVDFETPEF